MQKYSKTVLILAGLLIVALLYIIYNNSNQHKKEVANIQQELDHKIAQKDSTINQQKELIKIFDFQLKKDSAYIDSLEFAYDNLERRKRALDWKLDHIHDEIETMTASDLEDYWQNEFR